MENQEEDVPMDFYIGDTETCGLGEQNVPCEVALLQIDPVTLEVKREIVSLIDPKMLISEGAMAVHGITDEMVAEAPTLEEFVQYTLGGGLPNDVTMICHNVPFDIKALSRLGNITRTVCTLFEARQCIHDSGNHKLPTLARHFNLPDNGAHRALADCYTTLGLLREILRITGRTVEELANTPDRTVHVMPFGMHKGKLIPTMPADYLLWLSTADGIEPNLRKSVNKALGLK